MAGVNAAVVGLLASALYNPVWTSAVRGPADFAIAAAGFVALIVWRAPPLVVVVATAGRRDDSQPCEPERGGRRSQKNVFVRESSVFVSMYCYSACRKATISED